MEGGPRKVPCQRGKEFVLFVVVVFVFLVVVVVDLYALTRSPLLSAGVGGYIYIYIYIYVHDYIIYVLWAAIFGFENIIRFWDHSMRHLI